MTPMIDRRDLLIGALLATGTAMGGGARARARSARVRPAIQTADGRRQIQSYRKAVGVMRAAPGLDPTSWTYQALIHGIVSHSPKAAFIQRVFRDTPATDPQRALAQACWSTCPHSRIDFLPWHRIYIYFFERIVRNASGDQDFVLPYWDYTAAGNKILPAAFRDPVGGSPLGNPLYHHARDAGINGAFGPPVDLMSSDTELSALQEAAFDASANRAGFSAALENVPHNVIHGAIGGSDEVGRPVGDMSSTNTAGRDPIFWMHHANIDRLWESWLRAGGETTAGDYANQAWYNTRWTFVDETRARREVSLADLDALLADEPVAYDRYEEIPRRTAPAMVVAGGAKEARSGPAFALSARGQRVEFPGFAEERVKTGAASATDARIVVSGVESAEPFGVTFDVYLNLAPDAAPGETEPVGSFNLFGAVHQGVPMPKRYIFDVSEQVRAAMAAGTWPPTPSVSILPRGQFVGSPVTVDQIQLLVE